MRIAMKFKDGSCGLKMRPEFRNKSTMELILCGARTATSRDMSKPYNQKVPCIGEIVTFHDGTGREARCRITTQPRPLREIDPQEWSKKEGWDPSAHRRLMATGDYHQFEYVLDGI
jgi:uncharacterized protein YhfF